MKSEVTETGCSELSLEACVFYQRMSLVSALCIQSLQDPRDYHYLHHKDAYYNSPGIRLGVKCVLGYTFANITR